MSADGTVEIFDAKAARALRRAADLPQWRVAQAAGVSPTTLWAWERGVRVPTPEQIDAVVDAIRRLAGEEE